VAVDSPGSDRFGRQSAIVEAEEDSAKPPDADLVEGSHAGRFFLIDHRSRVEPAQHWKHEAGERERGSLEPLLTVPVRREHLIFGKILATCAYMTLSLTLTVAAFAIMLRFTGLERFGMSVNFGPLVGLAVILFCLPLVPLGAALMTIVAASTRSYREAQTYLGLVLLVPTLPLVFAGVMGLRPTLALMGVPSLSQHFLITSVLRDERVPAGYLAVSVTATLILGALLIGVAGRLYRREALLG